ncbi:hypothetical protein ACQZ40_19710, partial [Agrobacterium sp. 16-172Ci]
MVLPILLGRIYAVLSIGRWRKSAGAEFVAVQQVGRCLIPGLLPLPSFRLGVGIKPAQVFVHKRMVKFANLASVMLELVPLLSGLNLVDMAHGVDSTRIRAFGDDLGHE